MLGAEAAIELLELLVAHQSRGGPYQVVFRLEAFNRILRFAYAVRELVEVRRHRLLHAFGGVLARAHLALNVQIGHSVHDTRRLDRILAQDRHHNDVAAAGAMDIDGTLQSAHGPGLPVLLPRRRDRAPNPIQQVRRAHEFGIRVEAQAIDDHPQHGLRLRDPRLTFDQRRRHLARFQARGHIILHHLQAARIEEDLRACPIARGHDREIGDRGRHETRRDHQDHNRACAQLRRVASKLAAPKRL
ncbi:MAG: hypothetical protein M5U16_11400 [Hyphomicrobium sp.]|nr:hypothetical protein [Hyphomicrobium sp.]